VLRVLRGYVDFWRASIRGRLGGGGELDYFALIFVSRYNLKQPSLNM
jgi:hypothetical protein